MRMLLTNGVVACNGFPLLERNGRMYSRKLQDMRKEGLVDILRIGNQKVGRIKDFEERYEEYIYEYELGYYGHYRNYGMPNGYDVATGSDKNKREKAYKTAEVFMMMYASGIASLRDERPPIEELSGEEQTDGNNRNNEEGGNDCSDCSKYSRYYQISEIKKATNFKLYVSEDEKKNRVVTNSRAIGCMVSPSECHIVYHIMNRKMKWANRTESQIGTVVSQVVKGYCQKAKGNIDSCIVMSHGYAVIEKLLTETNGRRGYINLQNGYNSMYWIPYGENGKYLLRKMGSNSTWKEELIEKYIGKEKSNPVELRRSSVECDGIDGACKILLFCIPDIKKLQRFAISAEWSEDSSNYLVICYPHQTSLVKAVCGKFVTISEVAYE